MHVGLSRISALIVFLAAVGPSAAVAQAEGWKCVRQADRRCWRCADIRQPFNRLCPDNPCGETQVCVRRDPDLCPLCYDTALVCCSDATCLVPPGCDGVSSTCVGNTCMFWGGSCPELGTAYVPMCMDDAGVSLDDAGVRDAGVRDAGVRDAGVRDGGVDAGRLARADASLAPMDAGTGSAQQQIRFGGAGCRCGVALFGRHAHGLMFAFAAVFLYARQRR